MAFDANDLSPIEAHVVDRTREGEIADFTPMLGPEGVKPLIRAGFLRRLLLQLNADWPVRMPGVRIRGARIEGVLDLSDCSGAGGAGLPALELLGCDLPEPADLSHARLARLAFDASRLHSIKAHHARFDGPVSFRAIGPAQPGGVCAIDFEGAQIDGAVEAKDAKLQCDASLPREDRIGVFALNLRNARIAGNVNLRPGLVALGGVSIFGANIGGVADLRGARLVVNHRYALSAGNLDLAGPLHLNAGFRAEGPIWLRGARLKDGLHCDGGSIVLADDKLETDALNAEACVIEGGVSFRNGFNANGAIILRDAHIRGGIGLHKAHLASAKPFALDARNAVIEGEVAGDVTSKGGVNLAGAEISHNLDLRGADIAGHPRKTSAAHGADFEIGLDATSARIGGGALFQNGKFKGELLLADARIAGYCAFGGGRFINGNGWAIRAPNLRAGGNLTFKTNGGGDAEGPIAAKTVIDGGAKFDRAQIDGEVAWDSLELRGKGPDGASPALSFADARIGRALRAHALTAQHALIDLSGASCATLDDDLSKGWGLASTQIALEGFSYERLDCAPEDFRWSARTRWLRDRALKRSPQPYAALARVYADAGRSEDQRRALRAQHDLTTRATPLISPTRLFSSLFGFFSGYGLSPTRAAAALSAFLLIGMGGVFFMEWRGALVTPAGHACAGAVEPVLYAIDVALPVIDLGQQSVCAPGHAPGAQLFTGIPVAHQSWRLLEEVAIWRWALAIYSVLGAILTALAILTFSGVMKAGNKQD